MKKTMEIPTRSAASNSDEFLLLNESLRCHTRPTMTDLGENSGVDAAVRNKKEMVVGG
jgi:hypothetical protein